MGNFIETRFWWVQRNVMQEISKGALLFYESTPPVCWFSSGTHKHAHLDLAALTTILVPDEGNESSVQW